VTFLAQWKDSPGFATYPGKNGQTEYAEGIWVGYRWFDAKNIAPLFPFGFGLSYTTFAYHEIQVKPVRTSPEIEVGVSVDLSNSGKREGAEAVQLYVHEVSPAVPRPPKELKGFAKVHLQPGERKTVHFTLNDRSFAYYDTAAKRWTVHPGTYEILVGSSSRDIRLTKSLELGRE
jgi:beta-glucosidase